MTTRAARFRGWLAQGLACLTLVACGAQDTSPSQPDGESDGGILDAAPAVDAPALDDATDGGTFDVPPDTPRDTPRDALDDEASDDAPVDDPLWVSTGDATDLGPPGSPPAASPKNLALRLEPIAVPADVSLTDESPVDRVRFERVPSASLGAIGTHDPNMYNRTSIGNATGVALHDVDGDGDLDIFLGGSIADGGSPACLYRNDSTPGRIFFSRPDGWCLDDRVFIGAQFLPRAPDEPQRVILLGRGDFADAILTESGFELVDFAPALAPDAPGCVGGAGALVDHDMDGDLEFHLLCQGRIVERVSVAVGGDLLLDVSTRPPTDDSLGDFPERTERSMSLALGVTDLNDDGLLDRITVIDTFSTPTTRNTLRPPGGTRIRCAPDEACEWHVEPLLPGVSAWGSFMGVARARSGPRDLFYFADQGLARWIDLTGPERVDLAAARGIGVGVSGGNYLFGWSGVPGDFDGDGDDDLFVTQGSLPARSRSNWLRHYDALLVQTNNQRFITYSVGIGLDEFASTPEDVRGNPASHRAAWRADLDGDGHVEIFVMTWAGPPAIFRVVEEAGPAWCTLEPRPAYVPTWGYGDHATRPDGTVERARIQGHTRLTVPPSLVTRSRTGYVHFASGARVPFRCEPGERVEVIEPEWLSIDRVEGGVVVSVADERGSAEDESIEVVIALDDGTARVVPGGSRSAPRVVDVEPGAQIMLRLGGRYLARWWTAP